MIGAGGSGLGPRIRRRTAVGRQVAEGKRGLDTAPLLLRFMVLELGWPYFLDINPFLPAGLQRHLDNCSTTNFFLK